MTPDIINVIITDDEKLFRQGLVSLFKNTGINIVGEADDGEELLNILKVKSPDVILLDLEMPVLNGSKSLNKIRERFTEIKVIIISKYYDKDLIKDLFNRGACAFISKNTEIGLVIEAVKRVAKYGIYRDNLPFLLKNPAMRDRHYYRLIYTPAEMRLIEHLLVSNRTYSEIANVLCVTTRTIENQANTIYRKIGVHNRLEFIAVGLNSGLKYIESPFNNIIRKTKPQH